MQYPDVRRVGVRSVGIRAFRLLIFVVAALGVWTLWASAAGKAPDPILFDDIAETAGLRFVVRNSASGQKHQIETMISGVAIFDYNNDRKPDIYFVNGARIPELVKTGPEFHNRLYRNQGGGVFEDVTERAGVAGEGYGMGVAAADFDNDGFTDLFLPGVTHNILYRNRGDGTFQNVTKEAGLEGLDPRGGKLWSIAAGWFDYNNDGSLDLFVANYCVWSLANEKACGDNKAGFRTYCSPRLYEGLPNTLYRNNGNGTFTDVSQASGIAAYIGKGMGVAFADYDDDGDLDVFVANDTERNFLFRNEGGNRFVEVGLRAGVAYNDHGRAVSGMGADFRDYDNDGREDVFVSALTNETFPLFRNVGRGFFVDVTHTSLIGKATLLFSGWSTGIFDLNNDGYKDILIAGGDVQDNTELLFSRKAKQPSLALANMGNGRFEDVTNQAGPALRREAFHRGLAFGDLDGDGRVDAVITRLNESAGLLRNVSTASNSNHWLAFRLKGTRSNRDSIGARIRVAGASGHEQWNHVTTSTGLGSSSDRVVFFGLGKDRTATRVEIRWPSGMVQELRDVAADRYVDVEEPKAATR